uniref:Uncharacterized protein n=1 Tax=Arion vulgaris TaxID=1028688 RepID=A0A0B7AX73_9EUPU
MLYSINRESNNILHLDGNIKRCLTKEQFNRIVLAGHKMGHVDHLQPFFHVELVYDHFK